jgi:hypothetical protein
MLPISPLSYAMEVELVAGSEAMEELRGYARRAAMEEPGVAALEPAAWVGAAEARGGLGGCGGG